jgi:hypothetical protein
MLNLDEETEYLHRLVYLSNGTILMGEVLSLTQFGVLLKDPVTIISNDNKLFFSLLFNNMTDSRAFPISTTHIMSFANPNSIIIDHYNDFVKKVVPENKKLNVSLANSANNEMSMKYSSFTTVH